MGEGVFVCSSSNLHDKLGEEGGEEGIKLSFRLIIYELTELFINSLGLYF